MWLQRLQMLRSAYYGEISCKLSYHDLTQQNQPSKEEVVWDKKSPRNGCT
jgi:hypothetical protein